MHDQAKALLAQHAKTTQLFGVDFLPIASLPQTDHADHASPMPLPQPSPSSFIEPKPAPKFEITPSAEPISVDPSLVRACHQSFSDPKAKLNALLEQYKADAPHDQFIPSFTNIVFGQGNPDADLMFIGEAPGEQEDLQGLPFVGPAGQLLDKMITAMGLSRDSVYITNVLKVRPPNNATPTRDQSHMCAPYLIEQIRIINPKVIVTLGLPASHLLLDSTLPMRSLRGQFHNFPPSSPQANSQGSPVDCTDLPSIDLMPTYHPAFLLRSYTQENRSKVWSDLTQVMVKLGLKRPESRE